MEYYKLYRDYEAASYDTSKRLIISASDCIPSIYNMYIVHILIKSVQQLFVSLLTFNVIWLYHLSHVHVMSYIFISGRIRRKSKINKLNLLFFIEMVLVLSIIATCLCAEIHVNRVWFKWHESKHFGLFKYINWFSSCKQLNHNYWIIFFFFVKLKSEYKYVKWYISIVSFVQFETIKVVNKKSARRK